MEYHCFFFLWEKHANFEIFFSVYPLGVQRASVCVSEYGVYANFTLYYFFYILSAWFPITSVESSIHINNPSDRKICEFSLQFC